MTKVDKAVYKCPCCDYCTHFPKAMEAHQRFRKHFRDAEAVRKADDPHGTQINNEINGEGFTTEEAEQMFKKNIETAVKETKAATKTVKKPRTKKTAGEKK